jgi:hypothetical protein
MLAKLGRIIVIAQELRGLAERPNEDVPDNQELLEIIQACKSATLPTEEDVTEAIDRLRQGVEVWLNGTASAPLTFDNSWGGMVSCGCLFNGLDCDNTYPNCPGYSGKNKSALHCLITVPSLTSKSWHIVRPRAKLWAGILQRPPLPFWLSHLRSRYFS